MDRLIEFLRRLRIWLRLGARHLEVTAEMLQEIEEAVANGQAAINNLRAMRHFLMITLNKEKQAEVLQTVETAIDQFQGAVDTWRRMLELYRGLRGLTKP